MVSFFWTVLPFMAIILALRALQVFFGRRPSRKAKRICVVLGSGGHTAEMIQIIKLLPPQEWTNRSTVYVYSATDKHSAQIATKFESERFGRAVNLAEIPRAREVGQSYVSSIWTTLKATWAALSVVFKCAPDVILTNGPGVCIPVVAAGLFISIVLGRPRPALAYFESFTCVDHVSLSAKILIHLADVFTVQWPELHFLLKKKRMAGGRPDAVYAGPFPYTPFEMKKVSTGRGRGKRALEGGALALSQVADEREAHLRKRTPAQRLSDEMSKDENVKSEVGPQGPQTVKEVNDEVFAAVTATGEPLLPFASNPGNFGPHAVAHQSYQQNPQATDEREYDGSPTTSPSYRELPLAPEHRRLTNDQLAVYDSDLAQFLSLSAATRDRLCVVTVGSTKFDDMIDSIDCEEFYTYLHQLNITKVLIQKGTSSFKEDDAITATSTATSSGAFSTAPSANEAPAAPPATSRRAAAGVTVLTPIPEALRSKISRRVVPYCPNLNGIIAQASLIISHAGAGTIREALDLRVPTIVVPNERLMNNHQTVLASRLASMHYLFCVRAEELPAALLHLDLDLLRVFPAAPAAPFERHVVPLLHR